MLAREQTEEWKGWMQLMFLLYHYFAQGQLYNAIRVYIAGYVWMTGYGNFALYTRKTPDGRGGPLNFTTRRFLQMLFRLNFLGFCVCVLLNNECVSAAMPDARARARARRTHLRRGFVTRAPRAGTCSTTSARCTRCSRSS